LFNPGAGSTIDVSSASGIIYNQDVHVALTGNVVTGDEGDTGSVQRTFTVTRTGDLSVTTTVQWNVQGGTADAAEFLTGQDALGTNGGLPSGVVTFEPGQSTATIVVNVSGDGTFELDETCEVHLSAASGNTQ